ncbi:UNVERIFIED_CONTAM: hypothetical protein FKN15_061250 [Acipenser sinensis]
MFLQRSLAFFQAEDFLTQKVNCQASPSKDFTFRYLAPSQDCFLNQTVVQEVGVPYREENCTGTVFRRIPAPLHHCALYMIRRNIFKTGDVYFIQSPLLNKDSKKEGCQDLQSR